MGSPDRLYSEEELPLEFKLFVPQAQKAKKVPAVSPMMSKPTKENQPPGQAEGGNANKSEIPEESIQHDAIGEEEHHEVPEGDQAHLDAPSEAA